MRKTSFHRRLLLAACGALLAPLAAAQEPDAVFLRGAKVYAMTDERPVLEKADVWVQDGKIAAIGPRLEPPRGVRIVEASGWVVMPGLIDAKTPLMLDATSRDENAGGAGLSMLDGIDRFDRRAVKETVARGVTSVCVDRFVNENVLGRGSVLKLAGNPPHVVARDTILSLRLDRQDDWTGKKREADALNKAFDDAKKHLEKIEKYGEERAEFEKKLSDWIEKAAKAKKDGKEFKSKPPRVPKIVDDSPADEAFLAALRGELIVRVVVKDDTDLELALEMRRNHSLRMLIDDTSQCVDSDEELEEAGVTCTLYGNALLPPLERSVAPLFRADHVARLVDQGVPVAISGGAQGTSRSRHLLSLAAETVSQGVSELDALRAVTIWPARALGVEDRIGSIEPGKDADLVVLTGDPLRSRSRVQMVLVDGRVVFDAAQ